MKFSFFWHSLVVRVVGIPYSVGNGRLSLLCPLNARCVQTSAGTELVSSADSSGR